ncbi:FtsX-like permease family protein [Flammeovirga yaeyamensis]|uniref:FtsX-like permease family protein n=1 Tax=Flammeovirga yaeyamensis TaxID=367791 RepID=A0AAX1N9N8_9BACT|nr:FtsX-like permease family protein [Flammeovirga yaeyamensis]MBB3700386.1 lipoprotein-releasing system permease protein [Flammeovirga yaeyamensis]NMF36988.1 ABC transporter permease [Flammeovirga yaeyamensis]QWG02468.1 FtsX-like permease family protein [Flammeovirga yaeyamensis]
MSKFRLPFFISKRYFLSQRNIKNIPLMLLTLVLQMSFGLVIFLGKAIGVLFTFSPKRIRKTYKGMAELFIRQNFIQTLSNIAMVGVGFGTAALVIVLSLFNGMERTLTGMFNRHNPELKIEATVGKSFPYEWTLRNKIEEIEGVEAITEVIEDKVLILYNNKQKVVNMKGVSDNFAIQTQIDTTVVLGTNTLFNNDNQYALVGSGVYQELGLRLRDSMYPLQFWYPKRKGKSSLDPAKAFNKKIIQAGGVFVAEPQFDQSTVIVPIKFANSLLNYGNLRTGLEIKVADGYNAHHVKKLLIDRIGDKFTIKTRPEQQSQVLRALKIEKFFTYGTFALILGIASFNVFFALAMLSIEKNDDMNVLKSMGATNGMIRKIFVFEGSLVAVSGAIFGLISGYTFCFIQEKFKWISTGANNGILDAYPVETRWQDFLIICITVTTITLLASVIPARNAAKNTRR